MVKLSGYFQRLGSTKVLVIGDLLLDSYTIGKAKRISPEAPVAVIQVQKEESRPGGAGNVILNLISLGAEVTAIGRVGYDSAGEILLDALSQEGVNIQGIIKQQGFPTPVKNRIIAENQQIVRVDHEQVAPIPETLEQKVMESLPKLMQDVQVIAISDYGKGFLSRILVAATIDLARSLGIPVIADPKGLDFTKYRGTTILKPNLSEAYTAANVSIDAPLELVANKLFQIIHAEILLITRSEAGMTAFFKNGEYEHFPVKIREVKDVTGAGDTVLAMLTYAIGNGLNIAEAAQLSNIAAGIAIEHFGCARVTLSQVARRLLEFDVVNKLFDEEHLFALQEILRNRKSSFLIISGSEGLTPTIFQSLRQLSLKEGWDVIVYIRDSQMSEEFINMLASLREVNFIMMNTTNLTNLCSSLQPDEIYWIEGHECRKIDSCDPYLTLSHVTHH